MVDLHGFDANDVEPNGSFEPLPSGRYKAVIIQSRKKPNKSGTGEYLELTFQIIEGEYSGRCVWTRLNLQHPNPEAMKIARGELSAICRAVQVLTPKDSLHLHDLPLMIQVRCRQRQDNGEITNEVRGFAPVASVAPPRPTTRASAPAATSTPPWKAK
jgi:Protein of unknown function (DUF669)